MWKLDRQGRNPRVLVEGLQSAADFCLDEPARRLLVPDMKAGTILFVALDVYSPFSANLIVRADAGSALITATRRVGPQNRHHPARTSDLNPPMDAWYRMGAAIIHPGSRTTP